MFLINNLSEKKDCYWCSKEAIAETFIYIPNMPTYPIAICKDCLIKAKEKIEDLLND